MLTKKAEEAPMGDGLGDRQRLAAGILGGVGLALLHFGWGPGAARPALADTTGRLVVEHTAGAERVAPGETVTYTLTVMNPSEVAVDGLTVTVDVDETAFDARTTAFVPDLTSDELEPLMIADGDITSTSVTLAPSDTLTLVYTVTARNEILSQESIGNRAVVAVGDDQQVASSDGIEPATVASLVELGHVVVDNELISPGETTTYEVTVANTSSVASISGATLMIDRDRQVFTELSPVNEGADEVDGELVWTGLSLAANEERSFTYLAVAGASASPDPVVRNDATFVADASTTTQRSDPVPVAAPPDSIIVTHEPQGVTGPVSPGDQVTFKVTITNTSGAERAIENLEVRIDGDASAFSELWAADPTESGERSQPEWQFEELEAGAERLELTYVAQVRSDFGVAGTSSPNVAVVSISGMPRRFESGTVGLVSVLDVLEVTHVAQSDELAPAGEVAFVLTVENTDPDVTIRNLELRVERNPTVFDALVWRTGDRPVTTTDGDLLWSIAVLAPTANLELRYTARVRLELPQELTSTQVNAVVAVQGSTSTVESGALRVAGASAEAEASIRGGNLFALIILFLLISFVSGSFVILSRRLHRRNSETGIYIFTTVTLVGAVLVLAFGTTVAEEGALSLLAAVAGYVLGRRFSDRADYDWRPPPDENQPDGDGEPDAGGGSGAATTVASRPSLRHQVRQSSRVAQSSPVATWVLLVIPLVSPVLLVVCALWLLDSTGNSISRETYASAAVITLLLLVFAGVVGYLLLGSENEGPPPGGGASSPDGGTESGPDETLDESEGDGNG
jgi:hypothetical protein